MKTIISLRAFNRLLALQSFRNDVAIEDICNALNDAFEDHYEQTHPYVATLRQYGYDEERFRQMFLYMGLLTRFGSDEEPFRATRMFALTVGGSLWEEICAAGDIAARMIRDAHCVFVAAGLVQPEDMSDAPDSETDAVSSGTTH